MQIRNDKKDFEFIPSNYELPQWYFGDNRIHLEYSKIPSGVPAIERVIAGHPDFWCIDGEVKAKQPKTIVLGCDWSIENWSPEKKKNAVVLFEGLLKAGFNFLAISGPQHEIKPITSMDELSAIFNDVHFILPSDAGKKIAEEKNLPVDGLLILDYFELNKLLFDAGMLLDYKEGDIYASHILNSKFKNEVMEQLIHRNNKTNIIINEKNIITNETILYDFLGILNEEVIGSEIRLSVILDENLNQDNIINLIKYQHIIASLDLSSLNLEDFAFIVQQIKAGNLKHLPACEYLSISREHYKDLNILLSIIPNLKSIFYEEPDLSKDEIIFQNIINITQVEELSSSRIKPLQLQNLLAKMENLKILNLYSLQSMYSKPGHSQVFTESWLKSNPHALKHVKKLDLTRSDIKADQLQNILARMPDLEELTLDFCEGAEEAFTKEWLDEHEELLKKVKKLTWVFAGISPEALSRLISRMPLLEKLDLSACQEIASTFNKSWFDKHPDALKNLKRLSLQSTRIDTSTLLEFLSRCTNIEFLDLYSCNKIQGDVPKDWLSSNPNALKKLVDIQARENKEDFFKTLSQLNISLPLSGKKPDKVIDYSKEEFEHYYRKRKLPSDLKLNQERMKKSTSTRGKSAGTPIRENQKRTMDADTQNKNSHFDLAQIFFATDNTPSPHPSTYRFSVFSRYELSKYPVSKENAFPLYNNEDPLFVPCYAKKINKDVFAEANNYKSLSDSHFYAKKSLIVDGEWQALPSLSANEELLCYHLDDANAKCEIRYSNRDNLYYIRNHDNIKREVTIDYLIKVPQTPIAESSIPRAVKELVDFYNSFGEDEEGLTFKGLGTGQEYLNAIRSQKKGACRHRAVAFKDDFENLKGKLSKEGFPDAECRVITNGCHAFVEIKMAVNDPWITCNLGGYEAELTIDNTNKPKALADSEIEKQPQFEIEITNGETLQDVPAKPPSIEGSRFVTWKTTAHENNLKSYLFHLTAAPEKKCLVNFNSKEDIQYFVPVLLDHIHHTGHSVFYINSPDDLICSSPYLSLDKKGIGEIQPGPGGSLHRFLTTDKDKKKILVVNWTNFTDADKTRFNSIIDEDDPQVDTIKLPAETKIINLYSSSGSTMDKAFGRRIDIKSKMPVSGNELKTIASSLPSMVRKSEGPIHHDIPPIELYQSSNWKNYLLGKWEFRGHDMVFVKGPLLKAMEDGANRIVINNGLWDQFEFQLFWQQLQADKGLTLYGQHFPLPDGFQVERTEGYDWGRLTSQHTWFNGCKARYDKHSFILNPATLPLLLARYICNDDKSLTQKKGLLEINKNGSLTLQLTRPLNIDQWGLLLHEAKLHNVKLTIEAIAGINLPADFQKHIAVKPGISSRKLAKECIYKTNDRDATVAKLCQSLAKDKPFVLDISEYKPEDLLFSCNPEFTKVEGQYKILFHGKISDVWKALQGGKTVILSGQFSAAMADHLASLILQDSYYLNGEKISHSGKLFIVTENAALFQGMPIIEEHIQLENNIPYVKQVTLNKFYAAQKINPDLKLNAPWDNLISDSNNDRRFFLDNENEMDDESYCKAFDESRIKQVEEVWQYSPYALLAGKTGVGKSSFVRNVLAKHDQYKVYYEEKELLAWIKEDEDDKTKVLFIDEANLSSTDWSRYEGLFHDPPRLLIHSEWIKVPAKRKVIFAANPRHRNYGGERNLPTLFERHYGETTVTPFPARYVSHRILRPLLTTLPPELQDRIISDCLKLYNYIVALPYEEILITPRELEMIVLLVMARLSPSLSEEELSSLMCSSIHTVMVNLIPKHDQASFSTFLEKMTGVKISELPNCYPANAAMDYVPEKFGLTDDIKRGPFHVLRECLNLRAFRQENFGRDQLKKGGLGGVIIEGKSGVGKSQMTKKTLVAHGLKELNAAPKIPLYVSIGEPTRDMLAQKKAYILSNDKLYFVNKNNVEELEVSEADLLQFRQSINIDWSQLTENQPIQITDVLSNKQLMQITCISGHVHYSKQGFYHIPVGMRPNIKEELLEKALHEGAVALIDEINTGPMDEGTLNNVLMGYDRSHRRATHSGFMLVVTQNPVSMAGRRPASAAIEHRSIKTYFPDYTPEDLFKIISTQFKLPKGKAEELFSDYISASKYAELYHKEPAPTPSDLFKICSQIEKQNEPLQNILPNQDEKQPKWLEQPRSIKRSPADKKSIPYQMKGTRVSSLFKVKDCQSASKIDPVSAFKIDPHPYTKSTELATIFESETFVSCFNNCTVMCKPIK